jgi:hypothetical protein
MNMKLRKLAIAAARGAGVSEPSSQRLEMMAQLIVQECVAVCLEQRDPQNLNYKPSEKFAEAIKQRFGVE